MFQTTHILVIALLSIFSIMPSWANDPAPFPIWKSGVALAKAEELPEIRNVDFHVIKKWDKNSDGYTFLHGVALEQHKGKLYASFGHNKGAENTVSEEAQYRVSEDGGRTWGALKVIDAGGEPDLAVSHGVFLVHQGALWAFQGAYYGKMKRIHTRAYRLNQKTSKWEKHGVVVKDGFWPMNQPEKMADGNWIMPGLAAGPYSNKGIFHAAVAISHGNNLTKWDFVKIPVAKNVKAMWGESAIFVDGKTIFNIARYGANPMALVAKSEDFGRNWSPSTVSNLPMTTSKPAAGVLSTGQRYLVCTTAKGNGGKRTPLTIALSEPNENRFSKIFVIRRSRHDGKPGESADRLSLSYPYAMEHDGNLYVGYSNNGGR
ncbi:MAG: exo-alpha-sialidase, partial [Proteobacteria bacterium]|nr:exo-alpha-sialidase [Pseudomonadota bacterium]